MSYFLLPDEYTLLKMEILELQGKLDKHTDTTVKHDVGTEYRDAGEIGTNRDLQALYDLQLRTRNIVLANCVVIERPSSEAIVGIGKKVTFTRNNGTPETVTVGGYETPIKGRASYFSPLMKALIGKQVSDIIYNLLIAGKKTEVEILTIEDDPIAFKIAIEKISEL